MRVTVLALLLAAALPAWGESILVSHGRTVCGAVLDSNGLPVEGARIELVPRTGTPCADEGLYRSTTGQDGRFGLPALPAGRFDLRIEGDGFAPLERTGVEIPAGAGLRDLGRFVVDRGAVLVGRVVDPYGQPLAGAEIRAGSRPGDGPAAVSGPGGHFTLVRVPREGRISLDVCCQGFLTESTTIPELTPEPLDIVLEPAVRIAGRVFDPMGAPVAGAHVRAWLSGERPEEPVRLRPCRDLDTTATTDDEGRFVLEALPAGWWAVRAEAAGWLGAETDCQQIPDGSDLEVQIVLDEDVAP
jgi:protocatechuate 3,4-dioxygenase beta subunit